MRGFSAFAAGALAPALVRAHLFMNSPSPIPGSAPKDPLAGDGSNFPCHGVAFPGSGGINMPVGSSQLLNFDTGGGYNTAVHGGGSCQISVTYETDPVKIRNPANWYVILSIEGGCPSNTLANLDGSYTGPSGNTYSGSKLCNDTTTNGFDCVNQFQFNIPQGLKNGQATLAWTWFNTIGNREIYMNCAAIDITGGASDTSQMQQFPQLFVANLAASDLPSGCSSSERTNIGFPNPGPVVSTKLASSRNFVASASTQYPIGTPTGCPNNARANVATTATMASSAAPTQPSSAVASSAVSSSSSVSPVQSSSSPASSSVSSADSTSTDAPDVSTSSSSVAPDSQNPTSSTTDTTQPSSAPVSSSSIVVSPPSKTTSVKTTTVKTTTKSTTPASTCNAKYVAAVKKAHPNNALAWCKKYKVPARSNKSSVKNVPNAKSLAAACKCIINASQTTTTKKTTTPAASKTTTAASVATGSGDDGNDGSAGDSPDATGTDGGNSGSTGTSSAGSSTNTCPAGSVPCSKYNDVVCPDPSHYGICDYNMCAVSQAVAPGTECQNGQIVAASSNSKRSIQEHLRRHLRRARAQI